MNNYSLYGNTIPQLAEPQVNYHLATLNCRDDEDKNVVSLFQITTAGQNTG